MWILKLEMKNLNDNTYIKKIDLYCIIRGTVKCQHFHIYYYSQFYIFSYFSSERIVVTSNFERPVRSDRKVQYKNLRKFSSLQSGNCIRDAIYVTM